MQQRNNTHVSRFTTRSPIRFTDIQKTEPISDPQWMDSVRPKGDSFFRNLSVAAILVLCAVTLRTGAIPPLDHAADAVLTAATDQSLLDEQLGKLSFVSALFPEAVLVFGQQQAVAAQLPVDTEAVTHVWSEAEPYLCWQTDTPQVSAATAGEITGIFHGFNDELIVEVSDENNLTWLYGNLEKVAVDLGEQVKTGDCIGTILTGEDFALEVRQNGESIDPRAFFER